MPFCPDLLHAWGQGAGSFPCSFSNIQQCLWSFVCARALQACASLAVWEGTEVSWWQSWATAHWSSPVSFLAAVSLALSKAYTVQWRVLTHWRMPALGSKYVFLLGSPTLQLIKALGWPLAVPVWWYPVGQRPAQVMSRVPGTDLMCSVPRISQTLEAAVTGISPPGQWLILSQQPGVHLWTYLCLMVLLRPGCFDSWYSTLLPKSSGRKAAVGGKTQEGWDAGGLWRKSWECLTSLKRPRASVKRDLDFDHLCWSEEILSSDYTHWKSYHTFLLKCQSGLCNLPCLIWP